MEAFFVAFFVTCIVAGTAPAFFVAFFMTCIVAGTAPAYLLTLLRAPQLYVRTAFFQGWRAALAAAPWLRVRVRGFEGLAAVKQRPLVILASHSSYLDAVLLQQLPWSLYCHCLVLVGDFAAAMPIIGRALLGAGVVVVGRGTAEAALGRVEAQLRAGGAAFWFPEGRLTPDAGRAQPFRGGGMAPLVRLDCEVWLLALHGCADAWPRGSLLGGRPARITMAASKLCDSSLALAGAGEERERCLRLADAARAEMQSRLDALAAEARVQDHGLSAAWKLAFLLGCVPCYAVALVALGLQRWLPPRARATARAVEALRLLFAAVTKALMHTRAPETALIGRSGRPVVVVANHSSFADGFIVHAAVPYRLHTRAVTIAGTTAFGTPLFGTIMRAIGCLSVQFECRGQGWAVKPGTSVIPALEAHLREGGHAFWFPEGRCDGVDDRVVGSFKPGGFGAAARVDVEVWVLAIAGARSGRPRLALERLCESSAAFCGERPEGEQPQDFLAARAQASTQRLLDALLAKPVPCSAQ